VIGYLTLTAGTANLRNSEGTNETTGKKTFNTDVEIRAEPSDGVVRSNL
jgi:hypothetical protein